MFSLKIDQNGIVQSGDFYITGRLPASLTKQELKDGSEVLKDFFDGKYNHLL